MDSFDASRVQLFRRSACPENVHLPPEMAGTIIIHPTVSAEPQDSLQMVRWAIDSHRKHLERKNKIRLPCLQGATVLHLDMHQHFEIMQEL